MRRAGIVALALMAAAAILAGCGGKPAAAPGNRIAGRTLTIYGSVPLHGASRVSAEAVLSGAELALAQARRRIGDYRIMFRLLDDSTAQRDQWDPGQTTANARIAVKDPTTIGYIGEFNSGASAVSIPVLNRYGIPQISPSSTAVGLTSGEAGAAPGEPEKYYPTGTRTFARVVPNDLRQATAQVKLQASLDCRKTYVVDDGEVDGADMADSFELVARSEGLDVVGVQSFQRDASNYVAFAAGVAQSAPDCVLISAITDTGAVAVTRAIAAALPSAKLFGSSGVAESTFTDPAQGGIPLTLDSRMLLTAGSLGGAAEPLEAQAFYNAYSKRYGLAQPYAIYGYEAMSLMLAAISKATDHGRRPALRSKVLAAIFDTRNRQSVLGTYSIDQRGDTTIQRYGVYRVIDGNPEYWKAIDG
jgi:branched-chain amino acid transport system substrate-binding protein